MKVYLDGKLVPEGEARVPLADGALGALPAPLALLGCCLAENLRVEGGRVSGLRAHLDRLREGARALGVTPPDPDGLKRALALTLGANRLRRGSLRLRYLAPEWRGGFCLLVHPFAPRPRPRSPLGMATVPTSHHGPLSLAGRCKTSGMLPNRLSLWEAPGSGREALRLAPGGLAAEAAWANLLAEKGGVLKTPPLSLGVLEGTTRKRLIRRWKAKGGRVEQAPLTREDLWGADRVWVCSALRGAVRVGELDGRKIG